jgi:hypothetical protein
MRIDEILELEAEIKGNHQKNIKGWLNESCGVKVKYRLYKVLDKISNDISAFNKIQDELVLKYGAEKDGQIVIEKFIGQEQKELNPKYLDFIKEINELSLQEVEVELPKISISELPDFTTEYHYRKIFEFLIED